MTDTDKMLDSLWARDEAPARDPAFRLSVMEGVARRRLHNDLAVYGLLAAGLGAAAWALAPLLADAATVALGELASGGLATAAVAAAVAGLSLVRPLSAALSRAG